MSRTLFLAASFFVLCLLDASPVSLSAQTPPKHHTPSGTQIKWSKLKAQGQVRLGANPTKAMRPVYDANGRLSHILELDAQGSPAFSTDFGYDAAGDVTTITQHGGSQDPPRVRTFNYDTADHVITATSPEAGATAYTYDAAGNIATKTDALARTVTYTWDANKHLVLKQYSDGTPSAVFSYKTAGQSGGSYLNAPSGHMAERVYQYDDQGNMSVLTETVNASVYTVGLQYDVNGRVRAITYPDGHVVNQVWTSTVCLHQSRTQTTSSSRSRYTSYPPDTCAAFFSATALPLLTTTIHGVG